jgi:hypothetical protein
MKDYARVRGEKHVTIYSFKGVTFLNCSGERSQNAIVGWRLREERVTGFDILVRTNRNIQSICQYLLIGGAVGHGMRS